MKKRKQVKLSKRSVLDEETENSGEMLSDVSVLENMDSTDGNDDSTKEHFSSNIKKIPKNKGAQRSEASENILEFDLNEVGKETIKLNELIKTSQKLSGAGSVKKQLEKVKKLRSLPTPLSKPQMTKIKRNLGYTKICDELKRWEPVVRNNRAADQVIFPLKKPELQLESFEKASEKYVLKHPVAIAVNELLQKSENVLHKDKTMTEAEEKALKAMSLEEAKERHAELMKHRALVSYQEAKARRQNKIKSKRYHRLLKKERMKKLMKEFEVLEKTDAAKALEKLMEADQLRILERMTLKHRNTGKWAKIQKLRAKYNSEVRSQLKEDLQIGLKLKEKSTSVEKNIEKLKADLQNTEMQISEDEIQFGSTFPESSDIAPVTELSEEAFSTDVSNFAMDQETDAVIDRLCIAKQVKNTKRNKKTSNRSAENRKDIPDILDINFITEASNLDSYTPSGVSIGDAFDEIDNDDDGDEKSEGVNISEALADEDIIEEFKEDKRAAEEAARPKGVDLFLPGWGSWAGAGIKVSKKKRRRFFIPAPEEAAAKKNTLGSVILNEERDKKAGVHQVSSLPFPFSNIHQFESYIRQPIGQNWNPPSSFRNLTEPRVVTKAGKVIQPIDSEDVVLETVKRTEPQKKRKKIAREIRAF